MPKKKLTEEDVKHLAKLSALELSSDEITLYTKQFEETLEYVDNMQQLDTSSVSSADHMSGQKNVYFEDGAENERGLSQEEATANSRKHKDGYFVAARII